MYFPRDMTFQYFFFDTYPGYFLQALPVALLAGLVYALLRRRRPPRLSAGQLVLSSLFVCYLAGLLVLTLFQYDLADLYYYLFYGHSGHSGHPWFLFQYDLIPTLHRHFDAENWGNLLLYLPYGVLYPLFRRGSSLWRTVAAGLLTSVVIELLQPVFGRSFDINDIILNGLGVLLSAAVFFGVRALRRRRK